MKHFLSISLIFFCFTAHAISPLHSDVNYSCPMKPFELNSTPVKKCSVSHEKASKKNEKADVVNLRPKKCQNTTILHKYLKNQFPNIFTAELDSTNCSEHLFPFSNTFLNINQFFITNTIRVPLMNGL